MLNQTVIVKVEIPNDENEEVEHYLPCLLYDYLEKATSSSFRQIRIIMGRLLSSLDVLVGKTGIRRNLLT
ncbi:MAG: hypothetical protein ACI9KK_001073 [Ascidiaceihabitans sp.]|jgi:hypothetical protein